MTEEPPLKLKRDKRNLDVRGPQTCVECERYTPAREDPCLWKLEAQVDAIMAHSREALKLIRRVTARHRKLSSYKGKEAEG